ncbi:AFR345Wp [Eremothecium gossypii ATCC 10895]|uniref:AFR345Wp n=1 Tax=Eremothecium gossypii (strain ATCC 10895 / CBS 109.51 / FGSC 9923 / NRRL Y-1056) TaxID=284811 RepID=Q753G7_EREGS|nr:AFR345Wp [Eremothecium gossypii ATCC 10895]AAS53716.1 AFR345Wp [Eremothecium gossypii ATCC 10895]AEY98029.1 FAFR345Wp [Eremothecium gossypii FDAG1]
MRNHGEESENTMVPDAEDCVRLVKACRIPLVPVSRPAAEQQIPPADFVATISTPIARESSDYTLLSWLLNDSSEVTLTTAFDTCADPFRLFKRGRARYRELFSFQHAAADSNTTLSGELTKVSVFPRVVQQTGLDRFDMGHLCGQYMKQFVKVMHRYSQAGDPGQNRPRYLQTNLSKLVQSYTRDVVHDIVHKWVLWTARMAPGAPRPKESQIIDSLLSHYWQRYMVLGNNSFEEFVEVIDSTTAAVSVGIREADDSGIIYGIWIDGQNGILLLCNGLVSQRGSCLSPTLGATLEANYFDTVRKLMFFLNCSIMECCNRHLEKRGSSKS